MNPLHSCWKRRVLERDLATVALLLWMAFPGVASAWDDANADAASVVEIRSPLISESSGLAPSHLDPSIFWTHNDSGSGPQLFAIDRSGRLRGQCELAGASSVDWEDMASFELNGTAMLVVGDCGNNNRDREELQLYFFAEPDPLATTSVDKWWRLNIRFADGPLDCEAIAVDSVRRKVLLVAKSTLPFAGYYEAELPALPLGGEREHHIVLHRQRTLAISMATAMDVDPTSGDVWLCNYFGGFRFPCSNRSQSIVEQLAGVPEFHELPRWRQIEALAVDQQHQVWLTSEGSPARLGRLIQKEK